MMSAVGFSYIDMLYVKAFLCFTNDIFFHSKDYIVWVVLWDRALHSMCQTLAPQKIDNKEMALSCFGQRRYFKRCLSLMFC